MHASKCKFDERIAWTFSHVCQVVDGTRSLSLSLSDQCQQSLTANAKRSSHTAFVGRSVDRALIKTRSINPPWPHGARLNDLTQVRVAPNFFLFVTGKVSLNKRELRNTGCKIE
jgi:hypothetical protein